MPVKLLMGNEAIGLGALHAGVNFVSGYPGTPSTEVLETVAKHNDGTVHVEWSTNEKAALEAAAGAAYSGARALVTMKQVGLNVAADPLMTLSYLGVEGGLVILVADDPGPISSQTEQDTRSFARFSKVPVLDPSSPGEAYGMIQDAFEISEKYQTPVFVRPTTRVCHSCGTVKTRGGVSDCAPIDQYEHADVDDTDPSWDETRRKPCGFVKDAQRWVVFPRTSFINHGKVEARATQIAADLYSDAHFNRIVLAGRSGATYRKGVAAFRESDQVYPVGIACGGISYEYVMEALEMTGIELPVMKVGTPYPFPEELACEFITRVERVLCVEELDPVIEREILFICGKRGLKCVVNGKVDGTFGYAGEQSPEAVLAALAPFYPEAASAARASVDDQRQRPELPPRPPVLCAGCPHRASFYAVKRAVGKRKAVYCGDIGCYTLGNAQPLDMVDTCLCMGADITIAQGIKTIEPDTLAFSFIGDSTFFASGITGVINAVYNKHDIIICILDNSTTAMTGHQPHPGTGKTMMGVDGSAMSIPAILDALGVNCRTVDPLDLSAARGAVEAAIEEDGVRAIIFKSPCIYVSKPVNFPVSIDFDTCVDCRACIKQIGCPALIVKDGHVDIDTALCYGCELCCQICPTGALEIGGKR